MDIFQFNYGLKFNEHFSFDNKISSPFTNRLDQFFVKYFLFNLPGK